MGGLQSLPLLTLLDLRLPISYHISSNPSRFIICSRMQARTLSRFASHLIAAHTLFQVTGPGRD
jgi:hypothetical protein